MGCSLFWVSRLAATSDSAYSNCCVFLKKRKPESVTTLSNGNVQLVVNGEHVTVKQNVYNLSESP